MIARQAGPRVRILPARFDRNCSRCPCRERASETRPGFGSVVGLDDLDPEGEPVEGIVEKLNRGLLVEAVVE